MPKPCSVCGKPRQNQFRAFCSAKCRDQDLLAWASDAYVMGEDPDLTDADLFCESVPQNSLDSQEPAL